MSSRSANDRDEFGYTEAQYEAADKQLDREKDDRMEREWERKRLERETADALRQARKRVESEDQWWHPGLDDGRDRQCAGLAIHSAAAQKLFARANKIECRPGPCMAIGRWNDAPERTHAEVLEAFDRAIALAEARS